MTQISLTKSYRRIAQTFNAAWCGNDISTHARLHLTFPAIWGNTTCFISFNLSQPSMIPVKLFSESASIFRVVFKMLGKTDGTRHSLLSPSACGLLEGLLMHGYTYISLSYDRSFPNIQSFVCNP